MKGAFVAELAAKQTVNAAFLVQSKDIRQKKTGEPYLSLVLSDKTGEIDAKMWDNVAEVADTFDRDSFVRVRGETQIFQNRLQLTIHKLQRVEDAEVELGDFLPSSARDPEEMFAELLGLIAAMKNDHLRALLQAIFADAAIAAAFQRAPAAKSIHHAFLGGLLEHVLSLCALARLTAAHYPYIDADLLLTGVVLHDIGKTSELSYERSFQYSSDGQLLGHIVIGLQIVATHLPPGFPPKLRKLVEHMLLSHHGELAFGSPKVPQFAEALLLHHLDNLDSKLEAMRAAAARPRTTGDAWSGYVPALERQVLDRAAYLSDAPPPAPRPAPPQAPRQQSTLFGEQLQAVFKKES